MYGLKKTGVLTAVVMNGMVVIMQRLHVLQQYGFPVIGHQGAVVKYGYRAAGGNFAVGSLLLNDLQFAVV